MHLSPVALRRPALLLSLLTASALTVGAAVSPEPYPLAPPAANAQTGSGSTTPTASPTSPTKSPATTSKSKAKTKAKKAKKPKYTLDGELRKLGTSGAVSAGDLRTWRELARTSRAALKTVPKGLRRDELAAVLRNTEQIAERRALTASVAPSVFLTLQVNRDWWATQPIPVAGGRPVVVDSPLTWQYYRGEGMQIQWLATFGTANALATTKTPAKLEQLRAIQDEALRLASDRASGPAWQYLFDFGGGAPPWGSGMAQITGIQSLVRTSAKLADPKYQETAMRAMELIRRAPPAGARLKQPGGDHILLYTYTKMRVMNAFAQAVSGLHEIAATTGDGRAHASYVRAERQLRTELPEYVRPHWAVYSIGGSNETPSYHTLSRDLLRGLCRSLTADAELFAAGQPVAGALPPADPALYCATAERFTDDLKRTPNGPGSAQARGVGPAAAPVPAADPAATLGARALSQP